MPVREVPEAPLSMMISAGVEPMVSDRVTGADVAPSSSVTVRVRVCVPSESDDEEKDALVPMVPLILEDQR